ILLFYMYDEIVNGGLGMDDGVARSIMAVYGSLVYMSGIIGGWIADRLLGTQRTVFYGGIFIMFGHIVLALPAGVTALFVSMFLIVIGTGLLKPNVCNIVGDFYSAQDMRRDSGFSIFYMGINMGALIAPLIVGTLVQDYNYHLGFVTSAFGMFFGLIIFVVSRKKYLELDSTYVTNPLKKEEKKKIYSRFAIGSIRIEAIVAIGIKTELLTINCFTYVFSFLAVTFPAAYFIVMYRSDKITSD